jgi:hypothetical protein
MKKIQIKMIGLVTILCFIIVVTSPGLSKTVEFGVTAGGEFKFIVTEYSITTTQGDSIISKFDKFTVAGSDKITPSDKDNFYLAVDSTDDMKGISYTIKYDTFLQKTSTGISNGSEVKDFLDRDLASFLEPEDMATFFPYILPVSGTNDTLWTSLDETLFPDKKVNQI